LQSVYPHFDCDILARRFLLRAAFMYHPFVNPLFCRLSTYWLATCHYRRPGVKSSGIRIRPFALQYVYMPWAKAYGRQVMGVGVGDLDNAKRRLPRACLCWPAASSFTPVRDMSIHRFGLASPSVAGWATRASWSLPSADLHATVSISLVGLKRAVPIARPGLCILVHSHFRYNVLSGICTPSATSARNIKIKGNAY
jgi:hypothetical protein